ncbi:MAG: hypothetical protein OEW96_04645, partial [Betaproteobacteria bacterium]|nr:hypothetical protein [Betaproteobacteria bacterium]
NVSLRDARSRAPIADAQVVMRVEQVGLSGVTKTLEPYAINDVPSYGDYFRLRWNAHYRITAIIRRPGKPDPVAVKFEHRTY